jgi:hypothetical protein
MGVQAALNITTNSTQCQERRLLARSYPTSKCPRSIYVSVRFEQTESTQRYPIAEAVLDGAATQPYIHDCKVTIREGIRRHQFMVFFKNHSHLPTNAFFEGLEVEGVGRRLNGDIVIMRVGQKATVVNMRGKKDARRANWIILKYVHFSSFVTLSYVCSFANRVFQGPRQIPKQLEFVRW